MKKKSQVSMEFIMTTGMMLALFLSMFIIAEFRKREIVEYEDNVEFSYPCNYITSMINNVYAMGDGARIKGSIKHNFTIFGQDRLVLVWQQIDEKQKTFYCSFIPYNVTNAYNTSFTIPRFSTFTVVNFLGNVEIYDDSLNEGLVFWARMDEYGQLGKLYDWSEKNNYIELHNEINCNAEGFRKKGCYLNKDKSIPADYSNGEYISFNTQNLPYGNSSRTMCAWAKTDTLSHTGYLPGWSWIVSYGSPSTSRSFLLEGMEDNYAVVDMLMIFMLTIFGK
ncbi:MAG: hypothetical protein ACMXYG_00380 [Candidatus Woesearchaeota archaeon]